MAAASLFLRTGRSNSFGRRRDRAARWIAIAAAVAFHVVLIALLLSYAPARETISAMAPIVIDLIVPPPVEPPILEPTKPIVKPLPRPIPKEVELPIITAPAPVAPAELTAPPPAEPKALTPVEAVVAPEATPPQPTLPPHFSADYLRNPAPPYPPHARRMREQGKVVLRVLVSPEGIAERVELSSSSGSVRLDQSAQDTVRTWKFIPARQGDRKLAAWVLVPIAFILEN